MLNVSSSARYEEQVPGILLMISAFMAFPTLEVAPARLSLEDSGQYRATDVAKVVQTIDPVRTGRDPYKAINAAITDKSFTLKDRGLAFAVDPKDIRDAGGDEDVAVASCAQPAVASVLAHLHSATLTALYGISNTQACTDVWSSDSSDPVKDWHTARNTKFKGSPAMPNALHMPRVVADHLSRHPKFKGLFTGAKTDMTIPEEVRRNIARVFELEYVTIDESRWNTANEGQAASWAYIANQTKVCFYRRESGLLTSVPQTIRTFVRTLSIAPGLESMNIPGQELLADAMVCWTWPVPNPGGRGGACAVLAEPNIVNAETAVVLTGASS